MTPLPRKVTPLTGLARPPSIITPPAPYQGQVRHQEFAVILPGLSQAICVFLLLHVWGATGGGQCPAWHYIPSVLLGDMGVRAVHGLHMFAQGTGVCVALGAAWNLAHIGLLSGKKGRHSRGRVFAPTRGPSQQSTIWA